MEHTIEQHERRTFSLTAHNIVNFFLWLSTNTNAARGNEKVRGYEKYGWCGQRSKHILEAFASNLNQPTGHPLSPGEYRENC
jgi:hypothetical protein